MALVHIGLSKDGCALMAQLVPACVEQIVGVQECGEGEQESAAGAALSRREPLGYDRHGRRYWAVGRRVFV